jgi:SPP1 family predicted phage head-tail adaptor
MRAGTLRHTVRIEASVPVRQPGGDRKPEWRTIPRGSGVPASVESLSGGEQQNGTQQQAIATTEIKLRYRDDVKPEMRIIHDGRTLNIVRAFDPTGRRRELWCHCKEQA